MNENAKLIAEKIMGWRWIATQDESKAIERSPIWPCWFNDATDTVEWSYNRLPCEWDPSGNNQHALQVMLRLAETHELYIHSPKEGESVPGGWFVTGSARRNYTYQNQKFGRGATFRHAVTALALEIAKSMTGAAMRGGKGEG